MTSRHLSAEYLAMARHRIERPHARPARAANGEHHPLFDGPAAPRPEVWEGGDPHCAHAIVPGPVTEKYRVCRCLARRVD